VEGPTTDQGILGLRARQQRNFLATLLLSQGLPMIQGGDEIGRTQNGNNNAYNQDNEVSWYGWQLDQARTDLTSFTSRAVAFRRAHPVFRRTSFLTGQAPRPGVGEDVVWLGPDGRPMAGGEWGAGVLGMWLNGSALTDTDAQDRLLSDDTFLLLFNAGDGSLEFALPDASRGAAWTPVLDTNVATGEPPASGGLAAGVHVHLPGHCLLVLRKTA
jgi:glycogen operon protein